MPEKLTSDERAVFHLMLRALKGRPLVPRHVANASFAICVSRCPRWTPTNGMHYWPSLMRLPDLK
jgi:hypothetical protein